MSRDKGSNVYTGDEDFDELIDKALRIMKTKSVDYAEEGDRLAEFRTTAEEIGITMKQALGVGMNKHLRSIKKWIRGDTLKGEPIEDKLLDNMVYSLLGYKIAKEERRSVEQKPITKTIVLADIADTRLVHVVCDVCLRDMTLAFNEKSSSLTYDQWKREIASVPIMCNVCLHDPEKIEQQPESIRAALEKYATTEDKE